MIVLPLPLSINATYKTGKGIFYMSQKGKDWKEEAGYLLLKQWRKKPLTGNVYLHIWWFFEDKRRDISSGIKILEDVLEGHVYLNDRQIHKEVIDKGYDKKNPRVEIEVVEMLQ